MTFWDELTAPFEPNEIEWRVGSVTKDKKKGSKDEGSDSK